MEAEGGGKVSEGGLVLLIIPVKQFYLSNCSWFLSNTSIGGLAQVRATDWSAAKFVWAVLFVAGASFTVYSVYIVFEVSKLLFFQ